MWGMIPEGSVLRDVPTLLDPRNQNAETRPLVVRLGPRSLTPRSTIRVGGLARSGHRVAQRGEAMHSHAADMDGMAFPSCRCPCADLPMSGTAQSSRRSHSSKEPRPIGGLDRTYDVDDEAFGIHLPPDDFGGWPAGKGPERDGVASGDGRPAHTGGADPNLVGRSWAKR